MTASIAPSVITDPVYRTVGIILAILSGVLIGVSFIFKKKGLIDSRVEGKEDGHAYLKSTMWWLGMILMALGEIANFVAYALTPAVLVTPLGALSVVVSAVLSTFFLKEKLNFHGKLGCFISLLGVIVVVLNAPEQNAPDEIDEFMKLALAPGFLVYTILIILGSIILVWKVAPKYGKTHPIVYISICSFIGSLSVCTLQALGGSVIRSFYGDNQFTHWFIYILIAFVVITIITQINFLNKALNEFVTAEVTPVYYVVFTTATLVSSAVLYQGFKASPVAIVTLILAFLTICSGVVILQTSRMYEALVSQDQDSLGVIEKPVTVPDVAIEMEAGHPANRNVSFHRTNPRPELDLVSEHNSRGAPPLNREESGRSSLNSLGSRASVLQKIGTALNFERNDHLKPRTVFTKEQLEESNRSPRVSRSVSAAISRTSSTQGSNTNSQISFLNNNMARTISNPSVTPIPRNTVPIIRSHNESTRIPPPVTAIPEPILSSQKDIPRNSPIDSLILPNVAINEEPESYTTPPPSSSPQL